MHIMDLILTKPHLRSTKAACAFLHSCRIDPYIRKFVNIYVHTHHGQFINHRLIGYTTYLWTAFVSPMAIPVSLSQLHRVSDIYSFKLLPVGVLR